MTALSQVLWHCTDVRDYHSLRIKRVQNSQQEKNTMFLSHFILALLSHDYPKCLLTLMNLFSPQVLYKY